MGPGEGHCQLAPGCRECVSLGALPTVLLGLTLWWSHSFTPLCGVPPHLDSAPPGGREVWGNPAPPTPNRILLLQVQEVLFQELCTLHGIFLTRIKNVSSKQEHGFPSPRDREA